MLGNSSEIRSTNCQTISNDGKRKKGGKEEREKGKTEDAVACSRGENLLAAHDCGFAGSGSFGFWVLDFEFVEDFDIGISDFRSWL